MFRKELALVAIMLAIGVCDLQAVETGSISGTVEDYLGNPIEAQILGAMPTAEDFEGNILAFSGTDGTYSITDVPVGTWSLRCTFEGRIKPVDLAIQFAEGVTVISSLTTTVDFTLPIGGRLAGRVTNNEGDPVANATVSVRDNVEERYWFATNTDSSGDYNFFDNFGNLPPGIEIYEIEAGPPLGFPCVDRIVTGISVFENETTIVNIALTCFAPGQIPSNWVGGSQGEWGEASNWSPAIVPDNNPTNTFAVTINAGPNEVEVGLRQWRTIDQLDCYGEVELDSWDGWTELTLVDVNGLTNHGYLGIEEIDINGNVINLTGATLELCDMDIEGYLYNEAGGVIVAESENDVEGDLQNDGTLIIIHASDLLCDSNLYNNGQINLYGGECGVDQILNNNSTGVIRGFGVLYVEQQLQNQGEIIAYGGSLAIRTNYLDQQGTLTNTPISSLQIDSPNDIENYGIINVNAGGGVVFDCNLVNEPNAVIKLLGGTLSATTITQSADANFQGQGNITTANLIIETDGLIRLNGPTNIFGNVQINPNATLEISDGQTLIKGETICNNGTIHMIGGRVICQGGLTNNNCNIIWEPGTYTNIADFNLDGTVNFKDFAYLGDTWLWQASWY